MVNSIKYLRSEIELTAVVDTMNNEVRAAIEEARESMSPLAT